MNNRFDILTKGMAQSVTRRGAFRKFGVGLAGMALASLVVVGSATAAGPTFTTIDFPGAVFTTAPGINRFGDVVGHYIDGAGIDHGYLMHKGTFTRIDFPGADGGHAHDINSAGMIVGQYFIAKRYNGYLLNGGGYTSIEFTGAQSTRANGINAAGEIVGTYFDNNSDTTGGSNGSKGHGFLLSGGVFREINFPGADYTDVWRVNDHGQVLGRYKIGNGDFHVFLHTITSGAFISIDYPGATQTAMGDFSQLGGLNNNGDIASGYCNSSTNCEVASFGALQGFLLNAGIFSSLDVPGAAGTLAFGINDRGVIVGGYTDANLRVHGFLRTP
jgi:uncharacterized membrane protein